MEAHGSAWQCMEAHGSAWKHKISKKFINNDKYIVKTYLLSLFHKYLDKTNMLSL